MFNERTASRIISTTPLPGGGTREVKLFPRSQHLITYDKYPELLRAVHTWGDVANDEQLATQHRIRKNSPNLIQIRDQRSNVDKEIISVADNPELGYAPSRTLLIVRNAPTNSDLQDITFQELIKATYYSATRGALSSMNLEVEPVDENDTGFLEKETLTPWQENLRTIFEFLHTADRDEMCGFKSASQAGLSDAIDSLYKDEHHPQVNIASGISRALLDKILQEIPQVGQAYVRGLFEAFGFREEMTRELLMLISEGIDIREINQDEFLSKQFELAIFEFFTTSDTCPRQFLGTIDFSENGFWYWGVVEEEDETFSDLIELANYRDKIALLGGDSYTIDKRGERLYVAARTKVKKGWDADIPLVLPVDDLDPLINDLNTDCRGARKFFESVSFQRKGVN